MKSPVSSCFFFLGAALATQDTLNGLQGVSKDRTITKVVKMLQAMIVKSEKEGAEDQKIFAKFKCYCDQSTAEKRASIKDLGKEITLTEAKIEQTMGETGELSSASGDLQAKLNDNEAAVSKAKALYKKERKALKAEEADLTAAIASMSGAIEKLAGVGADQTEGSGADHQKFMAGHKSSLLTINAVDLDKVAEALTIASAFMSQHDQEAASSLLQAPFTGSYTSQSVQVMGMLKNMRDEFEASLQGVKDKISDLDTEHARFLKLKKSAFDEMTASLQEKQKELGENDNALSTKKAQLLQAQKKLVDEQEFLDKLLPLCEKKAKQFETRKLLRANEESAVAECVKLLSNDAAFDLFSTGDATSSFIQLSSRRHRLNHKDLLRRRATKVLQQALSTSKSTTLAHITSLLETAEGRDWVVTSEIEKMMDVIDKEQQSDKKKLDSCNAARKQSDASLKKRKKELLLSKEAKGKLTNLVKDPETGLLAQIAKTEKSLDDNVAAQASQTKQRVEQNMAYQKDVKNLVASEALLKRAVKALTTYYDDLEKKIKAGETGASSLLQDDPEGPDTPDVYVGQKKQGNAAIDMMEFIIKETKKELEETHDDERKGQADYEDAMAALKKSQAENEKSLANLQQTLAEKEQELLESKEELKEATKDKDANVAYLAKIKAECAFITENYDSRVANRKTETKALQKAMDLLKATPAYKKLK